MVKEKDKKKENQKKNYNNNTNHNQNNITRNQEIFQGKLNYLLLKAHLRISFLPQVITSLLDPTLSKCFLLYIAISILKQV